MSLINRLFDDWILDQKTKIIVAIATVIILGTAFLFKNQFGNLLRWAERFNPNGWAWFIFLCGFAVLVLSSNFMKESFLSSFIEQSSRSIRLFEKADILLDCTSIHVVDDRLALDEGDSDLKSLISS